MLKVYLEPRFTIPDRADGGIRRVVEAMVKYLPQFGVELVEHPEQAEMTAGHGTLTPLYPGLPFVSHNHGAYWREYEWGGWAQQTNCEIACALTQAQAVTTPSHWVKHALTRGLLIEPEVIHHGVELEEWAHIEPHQNYVLWNKARKDSVSDPDEMQRVAQLLPKIQFVTTIGRPMPNVRVLGVQPYAQHKHLVQQAGIYLVTARETFGIGTLEALASGVPVVGWAYGGQQEIITNGETGFLVPHGDYLALAQAIQQALSERARLGENAKADAQARWQWADKIEQYANLYKKVATWHQAPRPKVSVIVPAHNLARFLRDALDSVLSQTLTNWECLIIDDSSTDETPDIAREYVQRDIRFRYLRTHYNMGLSAVRNYGASKALGQYLLFLDADDMLALNALNLLASALDGDRSLHIVYGMLDLISENGSNQRRNSFPKNDFNWYAQMAHQNQIPTAAMLTREVVERSRGWRTRQWRAEDAEFWARVTSFGFKAAKVTDETTLLYRLRQDSKGAIEYHTLSDHDGNWLANIGWRSANSAPEGIEYLRQHGETVPDPRLVPFGAQGTPLRGFWSISHRQAPLVQVVIEANGNEDDLIDTLDSLMGQDMDEWSAVVIGESIRGFPYVRFVSKEGEIEITAPLMFKLHAGECLRSDTLRAYLGDAGQDEVRAEVWLRAFAARTNLPRPAAQDADARK